MKSTSKRIANVHNIGFYNPEPIGITHFALNKDKLALSRLNSTIEIWNLKNIPFIEKTITSSVDNYSIEGLVWIKNKLFSAGRHGFLIEYDLVNLCVKNKISVTGEAAYCIDAHPKTSKLAVGTEKGYINLFDVTKEDIIYDKLTHNVEDRILCLKFDPSGEYVASGSVDLVSLWSVKTGKIIHKLPVRKQSNNKNTIVWCIEITANLTIISGDSRGKLSFWDGNIGVLIDSFQSHKADILSLCLNEDRNEIYCSGVDYKIVSFSCITMNDINKWVRSRETTSHCNDVKALVLHKMKLISGGISGYLHCEKLKPILITKFPPVMRNCASVTDTNLILLQYAKHVEVWKLGTGEDESKMGELTLKNGAKKLVTLDRHVTYLNKKVKECIITSAISKDGKWVMFSTHTCVRLLKLSDVDEELTLSQVDLPDASSKLALKAVFTPCGNFLILLGQDLKLQLLVLNSKKVILKSIVEGNLYFKDGITLMKVTPSGKILITANSNSNITLWEINDTIRHMYNLPRYSQQPLDFCIDSDSKYVTILYSDSTLMEYDLKAKKTIRQCNSSCLTNGSSSLRSVCYDPNDENMIILYDESKLYIFQKIDAEGLPGTAKVARTDQDGQASYRLRNTILKEKHLVHMEWTSQSDLVCVEVKPSMLLDQLPAGLARNKFGTN